MNAKIQLLSLGANNKVGKVENVFLAGWKRVNITEASKFTNDITTHQ